MGLSLDRLLTCKVPIHQYLNYKWELLENNEDIIWWHPLVTIFDPKTMLSCFSFELLTAIVSVNCLNLADLLFTEEVTVLPVHWGLPSYSTPVFSILFVSLNTLLGFSAALIPSLQT